jgi:hypothetical protein
MQQRARELGKPGPTVDAREIGTRNELADEELRDRHGPGNARLECLRAFLADQRVGVVALRQEQEPELPAVTRVLERVLERAPGSGPSCRVAVETEHELARDAEQAIEVFGRGRRAERRDRPGDAGLREADHVHVAFHDQQPLDFPQRLPRLVEPVQLPALVEQRRLGRVQVLGLALVEDAAAERDRPAARVADREHHAIAEAVVESGLPLAAALHHEAGLEQGVLAFRRSAEAFQYGIPGVRCVADRELDAAFRADAAVLEVFFRARGLAQGVAVELGDLREQRVQVLAGARARRVAPLARHLEAESRREFLDRVRKRQLVVLHEEAERRAVRAAAEAVVELLVGAHPERGRLLVVERAAGLPLAAGLLELHAAADQLDDVGARDQLVDERLWDAAGHASRYLKPGRPDARRRRLAPDAGGTR